MPPRPKLAARAARKMLDLVTVLLFVVLRPVQALMRRASLVGDAPVFDNGRFDWLPGLEASWRDIRRELDLVLPHAADIPNFQDISAENRVLTEDDRWKTFFFYAWGIRIDSNCERCPATAAALAQVTGMKSAFYSILLPGKHIPPHKGPYAGVLRCHLGLIVPDSSLCRIRVGDRVAHWREGRGLVFDDTFEHEVWNESDGVRVVLFIDIARPLPLPLAAINDLTMRLIARSSLVLPGLEKFQDWDRRFARVWRKAG